MVNIEISNLLQLWARDPSGIKVDTGNLLLKIVYLSQKPKNRSHMFFSCFYIWRVLRKLFEHKAARLSIQTAPDGTRQVKKCVIVILAYFTRFQPKCIENTAKA